MNVFELFGTIGLKGMEGVNKQLDGLQGKLGSVGDGMKNAGKNVTKAGGVIVGAVGAIAIPSVKMAADFDENFRKVNVMLKASDDEVGAYKSSIMDLAAQYGVSTDDILQAYYPIVSAGYRGAESLDILEVAIKGVKGGSADAAQTGLALAKSMQLWGVEGPEGAAKNMDVMFAIVDSGLLTFEELASSFPRAAANAAALGIPIEELGAGLATLTKTSGSTEQASTAMDAILRSLITPSKGLVELYKKWGVESGPEAIKQFGGLTGVMDKLREETGGEVTAVNDLFNNSEAMKGILPLLTTGQEDYAAALESTTNATGMTDEAVKQMSEGSSADLDVLKQNLANLAITIGDTLIPILKQIMDALVPIIQKVSEWVKENPKLVKTILVAVGAVGGLLVTLGPILMVLGSLLTMLPALGGAFAVLLGPVGLVIAAIAAVIAIGVLLYKNWDTIKEKATAIWNGIANFFTGIWDKLTGIFKDNWDKILMILFPAIGLPILIAKNWGKIMEVLTEIWDKIKSVFSGAWEAAKEWGMNLVKGLWEGIKSLSSWIWDKVKGFAKGIFDSIKGGLGKLWPFSPSEAGVDIGEGLAKGIQVGVEGALGNVRSAMRDLTGEIAVRPGIGSTAPAAMGATITNTFNIAELVVREEADIKRIARELLRMQQLRANYG